MTVPLENQKNIGTVAATIRSQLGYGTAALEDATAFATAAQGTKADSALQPVQNLNDVQDKAAARANLAVLSNAAGAVGTTNIADASVTLTKIDPAAVGETGAGKLLKLKSDGTIDSSLVPSKISAIAPVSASVASNALTAGIGSFDIEFRSTILSDGSVTKVHIAAAVSLVVPSGATLGTVNATFARLAILALNNAGAVEPAIVNVTGGMSLDESTLISTTALSNASNSASTIYSTTARTNVAFRVVGYIEVTEATAGAWATAPSRVQGAGGLALSVLGNAQSWANTGFSIGTTYYNTTDKAIDLKIEVNPSAATTVGASINGSAIGTVVGGYNATGTQTYVGYLRVPPRSSYIFTGGSGAGSYTIWRLS